MLMADYLQRSLFKWKYAVLVILIISAIAAAVSYQVNRWLPQYALSFSNIIAQQFHNKISFRTVHYGFPNHIIFKDVKMYEFDEKSPVLQSSKVMMGFSFPLLSSAAPLRYIIMNDLTVNFPAFKDYLTRHNKNIFTRTTALPKGNIRLIVPNGRFYVKGLSSGDPITFKIDLSLNQGHVNLHGSWGGQSSIDLWGNWQGNNIDWKGFIFYNKFYILDIDGNLIIQEKDITLKQLSFSVNRNSVLARARCSRQELFQCDADIALKNTNLHLHAQNTAQGLVFNGWADSNRVHVNFENLEAMIINENFLKLKIKQIQSTFSIQGHQYRVPFEDLLASFNFERPYQKIITLSAQLLAGHCESRIFLDTTSLPWQIKSQGSFDGINLEQGLLSGSFNLQSSKNTELSGILTLQNGNFDNTPFQAWAATALQMPSLEHVSGADMSCQFKIDGKSKMFENLKLNTDDFDLSGFFDLDADNLVSSQGSVRFSKKLFSESPIGRHIIGLVRGAWTLPFEFHLSGSLHRMNFQWDKSPLKDKVRQHMFSFYERMIDRRIDARPAYKVTIPNESVSPG